MPRIYTPETFPVTLDKAKVDALPRYTLPPSYYLGSPGMGCFGDPPGYPTYFTQPVYNRHGNTPHNAPEAVLLGSDGALRRIDVTYKYDPTTKTSTDNRDEIMRSLYAPLPIDNERVRCWIKATMKHFARCYVDVERPEYGRPGTLIIPVPYYKLKSFRDDVRWNDEYRTAAKAEVDAFNKQEIERAERIATVDNHRGVQSIRQFYPDWTPPEGWVNGDFDASGIGQWWTTDNERPKPGECPGDRSVGFAHRDDNCQWCGAGR